MNATTPAWRFHTLGIATTLVSGSLAARLVWEQTWLTWQSGPQMVGFSLAHGTAALVLVIAPLLLIVWILAIVVRGWRALRGRVRLSRLDWAHCATAAVIAAAIFSPYRWWQTLFAARLARGPYGAEFLTYAAATGDLRTVRALANHGIPLGAMSEDGQTSLGAAAVGNQPRVIVYLLDSGLPVNTLNGSGDSALDEAIDNRASDAVRILSARGGARIHGSSAQHDSVVKANVDRAVNNLDDRSGSARKLAPDR